MGKCNPTKKFVTIALDKKVIDAMDEVILVLNKQKNEQAPKLTRSQFIQDILSTFMFDVGNKTEEIKQGKEKNNA